MLPLGGKRHVHWSYVLTGAIKNVYRWILAIIAFFVTVVRNIPQFDEYGGFSARNPILVVGVLAVIGLALAISLLQYFRLTWEVTDTDIRLLRGVLKRTDSRIPFERIHSVNIKASLVEQVFDVVSFSLDTAGGQGEDDIVIPSMKKSLADELKRQIYAKKESVVNESPQEFSGAPPADDETNSRLMGGAIPVSADDPGAGLQTARTQSYRIRPSELFLHGISNGRAILFIFLGFSFLSQFMDLPFVKDIASDVIDSASRHLASFNLFVIVPAAIAILAIAWVISVIASICRYFDFTVQRSGSRIEIERGLLTRRAKGCSVDRIQEMHIERPPIRRLIGYAEIRIKMSGLELGNTNDDADGFGVFVHPFIREKEIDGFLGEILPEFADAPKVETGIPRTSLRVTYFRYLLWSSILIAATFIPAWLLLRDLAPAFPRTEFLSVAATCILAFICVTAYRSWKGRGIAMDAAFLVMKRGAYTFATVAIPRKKIQLARTRQSPLQTRCGVADIEANSAAMLETERIHDVSAEAAFSYLEWIRPR